MAYSLKENLMKEDRLSGGHRMCAGCGSPIAVRTVLRALNPEDKAVVCSATSCLEVSTFMYPYTRGRTASSTTPLKMRRPRSPAWRRHTGR